MQGYTDYRLHGCRRFIQPVFGGKLAIKSSHEWGREFGLYSGKFNESPGPFTFHGGRWVWVWVGWAAELVEREA